MVDCARSEHSEFGELTEVRHSPPYSIIMYSWLVLSHLAVVHAYPVCTPAFHATSRIKQSTVPLSINVNIFFVIKYVTAQMQRHLARVQVIKNLLINGCGTCFTCEYSSQYGTAVVFSTSCYETHDQYRVYVVRQKFICDPICEKVPFSHISKLE